MRKTIIVANTIAYKKKILIQFLLGTLIKKLYKFIAFHLFSEIVSFRFLSDLFVFLKTDACCKDIFYPQHYDL